MTQPHLSPDYKSFSFRALCDDDTSELLHVVEDLNLHTGFGAALEPQHVALFAGLLEAHGEDVLGSALHYIHNADELASAQAEARSELAWDKDEASAVAKAIRMVALEIDKFLWNQGEAE